MLSPEEHYKSLISMYYAAPLNAFYNPVLKISEGSATVSCLITEKFHHSAGSMHGSVYFKLLDDAAFFAANSVDFEHFVLTADFRIDLLRPFITGTISATGTIVQAGRKDILARSELFDENGRLLATGIGRFSRSNWKLAEQNGYSLD